MLISVINLAQPKIADAEMQKAIRAINIQIAEDFAPYWQFGARLRLEGPVGGKPDAKRLEEIRDLCRHGRGRRKEMIRASDDARLPEANKLIDSLKTEQARGSFEIAVYYEKKGRWQGAKIYYNDVLQKGPESKYAEAARTRIDEINKRTRP